MRTWGSILVVALTVLLNLGTAPAKDRSTPTSRPPSRNHAAPLTASLDSLLTARNLDSVLTIVTQRLPGAMARGDSLSVCALLLARGQADQFAGRYREARETFTVVRQWAEAARDSARWMDALRNGAYSAGALGMRDEAVTLNTRLLELALATGDKRREAWSRTGFAYVAMSSGDMEGARAGYTRAMQLFRAVGDSRAELVPLVGLGRIYSSIGQIDSARACFQRVWLTATAIGQHVEAAHALNNLGTLEHRFGDLSLAMQYYRRAFDTHRTQGETTGAITTASNLALAMQTCGRFDEAIEILQEQLVVCEAAGLRPQAGLVLKSLGFVHLRASRIETANATFRRVLAMGDTLDANVRFDAAWGLSDALAVDSREAAIAVLEEAVERFGDDELSLELWSRLALTRHFADLGQDDRALLEARRSVAIANAIPPDQKRASAFLLASRCYRAVGDLDSAMVMLDAGAEGLRTMRAMPTHPAGRFYMNELVRAAEILLEYPADRPEPERYGAFFDLLEEFRATNRRESISDPRTPGTDVARPVTLRELQRDILAPGDLLIEFFSLYREMVLFVASRDTATCVTIPGPYTSLQRQIEDYCNIVAERPGAHTLSGTDMTSLELALGQAVFGPVADLVARADRLIIVPDRYLHALPFGLLALPNAAGEPVRLLDHATIFLLPSASVLASSSEPDSGDAEVERAFLVVSAGGEGSESLRGARAEARTLERRYADVVECHGPVTTEEVCRRMKDSRIIHIAAHIDVNDQEPWYSGIQIGSAPAIEESPTVRSASMATVESMELLSVEDSLVVARTFAPDPYLRAHQVAGLSLSARLAVLSGCESALGRLSLGEGVIGLGSAFMQAGVPAVIGSLWKIDDRTTVELMRSFYDGLADGLTVAGALRRAQLEMSARAETAHPFYWAGFVVVGDGRQTVPLVRKSSIVPVATIAVSLLLLTAAGWFVIRTNKKRESQRPL